MLTCVGKRVPSLAVSTTRGVSSTRIAPFRSKNGTLKDESHFGVSNSERAGARGRCRAFDTARRLPRYLRYVSSIDLHFVLCIYGTFPVSDSDDRSFQTHSSTCPVALQNTLDRALEPRTLSLNHSQKPNVESYVDTVVGRCTMPFRGRPPSEHITRQAQRRPASYRESIGEILESVRQSGSRDSSVSRREHDRESSNATRTRSLAARFRNTLGRFRIGKDSGNSRPRDTRV